MMDESAKRQMAVLGIVHSNRADGASCAEVRRRLIQRGAWGDVSQATVRHDLGKLAVAGKVRPDARGSGLWWGTQYAEREALEVWS